MTFINIILFIIMYVLIVCVKKLHRDRTYSIVGSQIMEYCSTSESNGMALSQK